MSGTGAIGLGDERAGGPSRGNLSWVEYGWVTASGRALPIRVDHPVDGNALGGIVIVPPISREAVSAFRTVRALAVRAAEAGFVSFSFSPSGTADSEELNDGEELSRAWLADLESVVGAARGLLGELPVHVVGLRVGAALTEALSLGPGEVRLLWEPVPGATFVRQQRSLRKFAISQPLVDGGVELYGAFMTDRQSRSLSSLTIRSRDDATMGRSVRIEKDRDVANKIATVAPHFATIPAPAIAEIVSSLPRGQTQHVRGWSGNQAVEFGNPPVMETHCSVGPHRLHGILTTSTNVASTTGIIFTPMGVEQAAGPGALWATLARRLAQRGVCSLRVDRRLIGEDLDVACDREPPAYLDGGVEDIENAAAYLRTIVPGPIIAVGVCAGAYSILRAAKESPISALISVNSVHWNTDVRVYDEDFYDRYHGQESEFLRSLVDESASEGPHEGLIERFEAWAKGGIALHAPRLVAQLRHRPFVERVGPLLSEVPQETDLYLVMGTAERAQFEAHGGRRAIRARSLASGKTVILERGRLDHSLLSEGARRELASIIEMVVGESATTRSTRTSPVGARHRLRRRSRASFEARLRPHG